jgi:uncharacterized protein YndB with AHSA1/START domain
MSTMTETTTQVFRVYIKSTPQQIWDAITDPEWNSRYGYPGEQHYDLQPGGRFTAPATPEMKDFGAPDIVVDGEVLESDPPHRLVQTWCFHFMPDQTAEGARKLTWEIDEESEGLCRLTVTHDVTDAPVAAAMISPAAGEKIVEGGGGWAFVLSDLKSLLETGSPLAG